MSPTLFLQQKIIRIFTQYFLLATIFLGAAKESMSMSTIDQPPSLPINDSLLLKANEKLLARQRLSTAPSLKPKELHIGGVFPMEAGSGGWPGGQACLPAVQMALADINSNPNVLPNYALRLHHHNSKV